MGSPSKFHDEPGNLAAGVLHDTIEKTGADAADLRSRFGSAIATLVLAVSEDPRIRRYQARKDALRKQVAAAGHDALMAFAADKISKARELRREPAAATHSRPVPQPPPSRQRALTHYRPASIFSRISSPTRHSSNSSETS